MVFPGHLEAVVTDLMVRDDNTDLLDIGLLLAQTCHLSGADDLARVLDMATGQAARVVGIGDHYGLRPGAVADLVVLGTTRSATSFSTGRTAVT